MCLSENERRKYLQLQGFFIQVKALVEDLEKRLKTKPSGKNHTENLEQRSEEDDL